ncbi:uncharacterized protein LOC129290676 isoform X2 [Prosopis cineraria]|uniref:uncharacterized protein LOC129290676 isoform X2 n=1 Tax=Prosopis cineraria TaxID=364024 RepID=UPI00240F19BF|nr:uncharacterized protein LOC129290676 isoform X2 [Prosopis cineraria]
MGLLESAVRRCCHKFLPFPVLSSFSWSPALVFELVAVSHYSSSARQLVDVNRCDRSIHRCWEISPSPLLSELLWFSVQGSFPLPLYSVIDSSFFLLCSAVVNMRMCEKRGDLDRS